MAQLNFIVKTTPIGMNNAYSTNRDGRRFLTARAREYKEALGWAAREAGLKLFKCPVVTLTFTYGDKRRRDVDSAIKLTLDAFNNLLWADDSDIIELHVYKRCSLKNPSVEISVH